MREAAVEAREALVEGCVVDGRRRDVERGIAAVRKKAQAAYERLDRPRDSYVALDSCRK